MLKKGDKVVMHTCGEAEHYNGKIWTCESDEFTKGKGIYKENLIYLEGFSGSFLTKYVQLVNLPGLLQVKNDKLQQEYERYSKAIQDVFSTIQLAGLDKKEISSETALRNIENIIIEAW